MAAERQLPPKVPNNSVDQTNAMNEKALIVKTKSKPSRSRSGSQSPTQTTTSDYLKEGGSKARKDSGGRPSRDSRKSESKERKRKLVCAHGLQFQPSEVSILLSAVSLLLLRCWVLDCSDVYPFD